MTTSVKLTASSSQDELLPLSDFSGSILPDASAIQYVLPRAGIVSLGIYNGDILIRTLFAGDPQDAGTHTVAWDGLDRAGNALPLGQYSWRLLMNDGLTSDFLALIGQTPLQLEKPWEHMPGDHQGPPRPIIWLCWVRW